MQTSKKVQFSKLKQMQMEERHRAINTNPALLSQLTPTEIAMLFPDYFRRGMPDVGGFREAISQETARKQGAWKQSVEKSIGQQGGWLERMRRQHMGGPTSVGEGSGSGYESSGLSRQRIAALIREEASKRGIDPEIAVRISKFEGLNTYRSSAPGNKWGMDREPSYGPFQLLMGKGTGGPTGMGDEFYAKTGINPATDRSEASIRKQIEFAMDHAAANKSWGAWYGRGPAGVDTHEGFNYTGPVIKADTGTADERAKQGATPDQTTRGKTPGAGGTPTTPGSGSPGQTTGGTSFHVKSGYIVPTDNSLYDTRNAQECATLGKAFNPSIGRSSEWTVVPGQIKAGMTVATMQYNNSGADRRGAGYHTGVAMTAPNEKGDFLLLEQYRGSGGAKVRWVNQNSYGAGADGTTSFGIIQSGGKLHTEISQEALAYGAQLASNPDQKRAIETNAAGGNATAGPGTGGEYAPGVSGTVEEGSTMPAQTASLMQPMGMTPNLMGSPMNMMMGMMGGMGGMGMQSATPLGLITTAMGFIMPLIGSLAGGVAPTGEGIGGPTNLPNININRARRGHRASHHGASHGHSTGAKRADAYSPNVTTTGLSHRSNLVDHTSVHAAPAIGATQAQYNAFREAVASIESRGGNYNLRGGSSNRFAGAYQMGGAEIKEVAKFLGEQAPVAKMKGSRKIAASDTFLNDPKMQERYFDVYVTQHHNYLMKNNKQYASMSPEERLKVLGYAHNQGAGGANKWLKTGKSNADAFGTDATKYAYRIGKQFEGLKVAQAAGTQYAGVTPTNTTAAVGPSPVTPGTTATPTTQMAQAKEPSFFEKAKIAAGLSTPSVAKEATSTTTPGTAATSTTPAVNAGRVLSNSMNIEAQPAPTTKFSKEARNPLGIYSLPSRNDVTYQFGAGKKMSASVIPQTNVPATPAAPVSISATPGLMPAPGPAPDVTSVQMTQMRNEMAAVAAQQQTPAAAPRSSTPAPAPSQGFDAAHAMHQIAQPYNTPSFHRAVTRAYGSETPGEVGQNHFNNGNAR